MGRCQVKTGGLVNDTTPANPLLDTLAEEYSKVIDCYIRHYGNQEIMGTIHSVPHMPANNYLYNKDIPVKDSAFYNGLDQDLFANKPLDTKYILARNIDKRIRYDHNNVQSTVYKLKTIIKV